MVKATTEPANPKRDKRYRIIGKRIRARRRRIGMSQECLAELVGVTFQQIQKYEKGQNRVSALRLHDIGKKLGVDISFFFKGL